MHALCKESPLKRVLVGRRAWAVNEIIGLVGGLFYVGVKKLSGLRVLAQDLPTSRSGKSFVIPHFGEIKRVYNIFLCLFFGRELHMRIHRGKSPVLSPE